MKRFILHSFWYRFTSLFQRKNRLSYEASSTCISVRLSTILALLTLCFIFSSCQKEYDSGLSESSSKKKETTNNEEEGNGRPTDNDEVLPGYLVGPEGIEIFEISSPEETVVKITGEKGAVQVATEVQQTNADNSKALVTIWLVDTKAFEKSLSTIEETEIPGKLLAKVRPKADGSFDIEFKIISKGVIVITTEILDHSQTKLVFDDTRCDGVNKTLYSDISTMSGPNLYLKPCD